jgi:hypothetical protein
VLSEFCGDGVCKPGVEAYANCPADCQGTPVWRVTQITDNALDDEHPDINDDGLVVYRSLALDYSNDDLVYSQENGNVYTKESSVKTWHSGVEDILPKVHNLDFTTFPFVSNTGLIAWTTWHDWHGSFINIAKEDGTFELIRTYGRQILPMNNQGEFVFTDRLGNEVQDWSNREIMLYDKAKVQRVTTSLYNRDFPRINDYGEIVFTGNNEAHYHNVFLSQNNEIVQLTTDKENTPVAINNNGWLAWYHSSIHGIKIYDGETTHDFVGYNFLKSPHPLQHFAEPVINDHNHLVVVRYTGELMLINEGFEFTLIRDNDNDKSFSGINNNGIVVWSEAIDGEDYEVMIWDGEQVLQMTDNDYDDA